MIVSLLIYYEHACVAIKNQYERIKAGLRTLIGPAPQNYYLLSDGRVLPTTIVLPGSVLINTYIYNANTRRISRAIDSNPIGRWRPLHFLGITIVEPTVGSFDISEWLGEMRANPVPRTITPTQLLHLHALSTNTYIPASGNATVIHDNGEMTSLELT